MDFSFNIRKHIMSIWLVMMAPQYIQYFPVIKINIFARVCLNLTTLISTPSEITDVLMHFLFVQITVIKMLLRLFKCQFDLCFPFDKFKTRMLHPSDRPSVCPSMILISITRKFQHHPKLGLAFHSNMQPQPQPTTNPNLYQYFKNI